MQKKAPILSRYTVYVLAFLYLYCIRALALTPEDQGLESSNAPMKSTADDTQASPSTPAPPKRAHLKTLSLLPIPPIPVSQEPDLGPSTPTPAKGTRSAKRRAKTKANAAEAVPGEVVTANESDVLPSAKKQKSVLEGV